MLHGLVADLIGRRGQFVVPSLCIEVSVPAPFGRLSDVQTRPAVRVPVDNATLARRAPWGRPCVVASIKGRELLIHIAVQQTAGADKRVALAELDQSAVEINLTKDFTQTVGELSTVLFTADARKSWLFNNREAALRGEMETALTAKADEQRREHREALRAQQEQRERELAERDRVAIARARPESTAPSAPPKPERPAELSASVEYASLEGRVWLLHSSNPDIYFQVERGVELALRVLTRCGAVAEGNSIYRISRNGWATASIELRRHWKTVAAAPSMAHSSTSDKGGQ